MKKGVKKVISIVLVLVMLVSVCSCSFASFAEEQEQLAVPGLQTMLTDGKALKEFVETNYLNLAKLDELLVNNLPSLSQLLCAQLGDLFFQMGYNAEQYPADEASLMIALARVLGSLNAEVFREPEKVETTDMSLIYHFAFLDGTEYIESVNAALPEEVRFDISEPFLKLDDAQKAEITEYYTKWKSGALRMDDFDITPYLGEVTPAQYLKAVLLVFIADDERLPAIAKKAIDFELSSEKKAVAASAVADILDHLHTAPVSAVLRQLANADFQELLISVLQTANKVTIKTDAYSYHLFNEGIFTDTDGSAVPNIVANEDGTYSYFGNSFVSEYIDLAQALFALLNGADTAFNESVLETVFKTRFEQLKALVATALDAGIATVNAQQSKLLDDIKCAEIEKRFAQKKIDEIDSGAAQQALIAEQEALLEALSEEIAALQEQLLRLENEEAVAKEQAKGYYDALAEFEAQMNEENSEQIAQNPEYIAAKERVEQVEASLAENYAAQKQLGAQIGEQSEKADAAAQEINRLKNEYVPADAKSVYHKMITSAEAVISESEAALSALPDSALAQSVGETLKSLVNSLLSAFDGVYDTMLNESPLKAAVTLVYGLKDFADSVEAIDWNAISAVTDPLFAQADAFLNNAAGRYIGADGGNNIFADVDALINNLFDTYGVYNYINVDYLDQFISTEILGDNSDIMQVAAGMLAGMFPNVQPTYDSVISCLIPVLSAFNFGEIMANLENIADLLGLASPTAFAYLAGLEGNGLVSGYLNTINAGLVQNGYTGTPVSAIISLSQAQQSSLMRFVQMESSGSSLAEIQAAGFRWENYTGGADNLAIANAFLKIALGDENKLGELMAAPGLGAALINLLCDLVNDLKTKPVSTILKKISDGEGLRAIANFVLGLLNDNDPSYKSYELYFTEDIVEDGKGHPAFYVKKDGDNYVYIGPKNLEQYVPLVSAVIAFFNGLDQSVNTNGGDLLKALLFDKVPEIKNIIRSLISFTDENGKQHPGAVFYLLLGYADYQRSANASLCYDLLISIAQAVIDAAQEKIDNTQLEIELWQQYLEQAKQAEDAARLAKAKELGVLDESAAVYDEAAVDAAIEAKIATLTQEVESLGAVVDADREAYEAIQANLEAAQAAYDKVEAQYSFIADDMYDDMAAIFDEQEIGYLDELRDNYEEDYNEVCGDDEAFNQLAMLISEHYEEYDGDTDSFLDEYIYGENGWNLVGKMDEHEAEVIAYTGESEEAGATLTADEKALNKKEAELIDFTSGSAKSEIVAAGEGIKIRISDNELGIEDEFTADDIEGAITNIQNNTLAQYNASIAAQREMIEAYRAEQSAVMEAAPYFNTALVPLAASAADVIAQGVIDILCGNRADGSENVYHYIMNHDIMNILTTGGRLESVFNMIIGIYEPALTALVSEGLLSADTANQLIAAVPDFAPFYAGALARYPDAFRENPIGATGDLIRAFCECILSGFSAVEESATHDVLQLKKINRDIIDIFDASFAGDWLDSYSKSVVTRTGEIYQLIVDILGLSFVTDFLNISVDDKGSLSGKLDMEQIYADVTVYLYRGDTLISSQLVQHDGDGAFTFAEVPEGSYVIKLSVQNGVPFEIKSIDITANGVTDISSSRESAVGVITVPVGDVTGDGSINVEDLSLALNSENYGTEEAQCDINCDGRVDMADISIILAEGNYTAEAMSLAY